MPSPFAPVNFSLRNVQSSNPRVYQTEPRQSVTASDDYYSFSDRSSPDSRETIRRFETAQSHQSSQASLPPISQTNQALELGDSHRQHQRVPTDTSQGTVRPGTASTVRFGENRVSQLSPESDETPHAVLRGYAGAAPTPGLDDSPYVRFAIDQLTRDEEVAGLGQGSISSRDNYPVDRLVWDDGLGCFTRTRTPIRHDNTPPGPSHTSPSPQALPQRVDSVDPESFMPIDPPEQTLLYPSLNYRPIVLRPWALVTVILCCLLMIAGVVFCNVWSQREGLWDYDGQGSARYFVMQFLPQILAASIMICTFVIQAAVYRIAPFAIMAAERQLAHVLGSLPVLSHNFFIPDFSHFRHGEPLIGLCLFSIWLSNFFSIPLLSCLFQVKYYRTIAGQGAWKWTSVQAVGWTLVGSYGLLAIGLLLLLVRFLWGCTGLMWDPTSLADLVALIQRSNTLHDYEQSEVMPSVGKSLEPRVLRLGYWRLSSKHEIFYGIGEVDAPVRSPSLHQSDKSRKKQPHGLANVCFDVEKHGDNSSFDHHLYSPLTRYRWTPWFLRTTAVCIWTVIVFALFIAFVCVSFIHHAIEDGFLPKLPTLPSATGFSSSNFLYSFIPALIGNVLFLLWQPIDVAFRALQPFAELSSPHGTTAEKSIFLSYPASLPIQATVQALLNKHWQVAWISVMSLVFAGIPILSGGIFLSLFWPSHGNTRVTTLMPAFYALVIFCGIYAVSFLTIWPRRCRHLPHDISTLADLISFLYQSPLLADKLLREPRCKTDLVTRLIIAPPGERELPLYGFGVYVGRDGREHLGIDRFRRPGRTDMLITTGF